MIVPHSYIPMLIYMYLWVLPLRGVSRLTTRIQNALGPERAAAARALRGWHALRCHALVALARCAVA